MMYKKMLVLGLALAISTVASQVTSAAIITGVERRNSSYDAPPEIAGPLVEGALSYVDRRHQYKRIPVALAGADYIKIANNDKTSLYYELDVTLSQDATLFLLLDNRLGNGYVPANSEKGKLVAPDLIAARMSWVIDMGFVDTGDDIAIHEYRDIEGKLTDLRWLSVYARDVSAGKITLLPQDNLAVLSNYNLYGVAAIPVKVSRDDLRIEEQSDRGSEVSEWSLSNLSTIRRIVPNGWKGSWSPDGLRLVFGKPLGKGLQILDTESGKTTDLTPSGKDPAWSPDGRFIAYIKEQRFNAYMSEEVWIVEPTGQSPRKIADAGYPHWSADGKLLFVQSRKENKIFAIDIDKPDAKAKVLYDGPQSWYPAVSSDGKRIAFGKRNALVVIDIEIGQTVLTWPTPGNRGLLPAWSPDGNLVAYGGFDNVSSGLWVLDMRTEDAVQVSKGPCTMPAWSMDGTKLAFDLRSGNRREIWMVEKKPKPSQLPVDTKPDRLITAPSVPARAAWTTLVPARSVWKYLDDGSIQGTAWYEPGFDDSSWASGPAELGYGDGDEATVVSYGMEEDYKYPTTYFRHSFNVPDASIYQSLLLAVLRDDGAVVYLNGTEIFRTNMPGGDIDYSTAASTAVGSRAESTFYDIPLRAKSLVNGNNVLAVEIHQVSDISTDISFDLSLAASTELVDALVATDSMEEEGRVLAIDDFDGKLSLDWKIQNPDDSHYSLTNKPGTLNITTQKGDFYRLNTNYKNLFLIDNPVAVGEDFEITTCLLSFVPVGNFNQAGLVCFNDEDNYIKWTYEWNGARRQQVFALIRETRGRVAPHTYVGGVPKAERIWLRLTNRGNRYTYSSSTDGKSFREHGTLPWGDRAPKWVGLMAFNGPTSDAPEIDASFDFFEVRAIPAKAAVPAAAKAATFVIPEENLKIPEEMKACAENLQKMHTAIKKYEEDKDKLPNWLSDLVPDYITNDALLCSNDARHKAKYSPDPKLPCSYSWELSSARIPGGWDPTRRTQYRDWKTQQIKLFGDVVPMVRCHHHGSKKVLNLSVGSQIYWGRLSWEFMFKPDYRFGDESPERQRRGIQLAGQLRITGVVRDEAGMPVDGVEISILPSRGRDFRVDAEGEFEVSWQPRSSGGRQSDNYLVARHRERNLVAVVRIDKDTDTLEIKLGPGVIFTGKVVDPEGEGIAGARIMTMLRVSNQGMSLRGGPAETDGEGQFEIRAIPPEHEYSVFATAEGYGQRHAEVRTDDAVDNRVDIGQLTLAVANLSVSGVVVDAEDKPVADARVYCYGEGQSGSSTKTDAEGKFTLEKICAGKLRISVSVQGKTRLYGNVETEGGATNVKVVVSERDALATRDVPKLPDGPEPAPDAIVFDMAYRGLDAGEDELRYNSYWGYGGGRNDKGNPFIKAVEKIAGKIETVYNPNFKGAELSALELAGDKPVALYFDMNADGKLADNEKILPAGEPDRSGQVQFITPDFMMTARDGSKIPFRVLLRARKGGNSMWSPSCVLQGASTINDKKVRMLLFCNGPDGKFTQFGRGNYSLQEQEPEEGRRRISRQTLSSLINYDDQFYRLRFLKSAEKEGPMRLVLEKDISPTGELVVKLAGSEGLKARLGSVRITGSRDSTISFSVSGDKGIELPAGEYKIASGSVYYGSQKDDEWYVSFSGAQEIEIKGGEYFTSELGEPKIHVSALDQKDRYRSNAEEKTVYAKGTTVFFSPRVKGKSGELYSRFRRSESRRHVDVCPTVEITDSDGKQIVSSKMEYG